MLLFCLIEAIKMHNSRVAIITFCNGFFHVLPSTSMALTVGGDMVLIGQRMKQCTALWAKVKIYVSVSFFPPILAEKGKTKKLSFSFCENI